MNAHVPALQRTVLDLVEEYQAKDATMDDAIKAYEDAYNTISMAVTVQGAYAGNVLQRPYVNSKAMRSNLLKSGWRAIYDRLGIDRIASAQDKRLFEQAIVNPAPLTFENAKATFGDYFLRTRYHILRGLAEVFCQLDKAYRSHSNVKIGVQGLPKRIILTYVAGYGSYGYDRLRDTLNALAAYRSEPLVGYDDLRGIENLHCFEHKAGEVEIRGLTVKKFKNGNAHVIFDSQSLLDINMALAEFYGDVLPDVEDDDVQHQPSTDVAKDLQFYWSPPAVVEKACDFAGIHATSRRTGDQPRMKVLEPSCGDGRIMDELRARGCEVVGIEYHRERAMQAQAKGHNVLVANFLEVPPVQQYDRVVMNPPFYGRHYLKHVRHALKFLKPGGQLVAILPATAHYDHAELPGTWEDLPVGSFSEAGTNVPTGLLRILVPQ